jgi:hypothetical protein
MTLAAFWLNQQVLSLLNQRAILGKLVVSDSLLANAQLREDGGARIGIVPCPPTQIMSGQVCYGATTLLSSGPHTKGRAAGTGVYFNNCEVSQEMHPSQMSHAVRYTTCIVPSLPEGKPMSQPPQLLTQVSRDGAVTPEESSQVSDIEQRETDDPNERNEVISKACKRDRPFHNSEEKRAKRARPDAREPESLSTEQKAFVEAALALKSYAMVTPTYPPKSLLNALPPPPFSLASS